MCLKKLRPIVQHWLSISNCLLCNGIVEVDCVYNNIHNNIDINI